MAWKENFETPKSAKQMSIEDYHQHMQMFSNTNLLEKEDTFAAAVRITESKFGYLLKDTIYEKQNETLKSRDTGPEDTFAIACERLKLITLQAQKQGYYGDLHTAKEPENGAEYKFEEIPEGVSDIAAPIDVPEPPAPDPELPQTDPLRPAGGGVLGRLMNQLKNKEQEQQ